MGKDLRVEVFVYFGHMSRLLSFRENRAFYMNRLLGLADDSHNVMSFFFLKKKKKKTKKKKNKKKKKQTFQNVVC